MSECRRRARLQVGTLSLLLLIGLSTACRKGAGEYAAAGDRELAAGQVQAAIINYQKAIQAQANNPEFYIKLAQAFERQNDWRQAGAALQQAVQRDPKNSRAKVMLGEVHLKNLEENPRRPKFSYDALNRIAAELLQADPKSLDGLRFQAFLAKLDGKVDEALAKYSGVQAGDPWKPAVVLPMTEILVSKGKKDEALKMAAELIQHRPDSLEAYDFLYRSYLADRRETDAEEILKRKCSQPGAPAGCKLQLAEHYSTRGKASEAQRILEELTRPPLSAQGGFHQAGLFQLRAGRFNEAIDLFNRSIAAGGPLKKDSQEQLVSLYRTQRKSAEALKLLDTMLQEDPSDAATRSVRALLLLESGDAAKAVTDYQQVIQKDPNNDVVKMHLADAYLKLGQKKEATAILQSVATRRPELSAAQIKLAGLELSNGHADRALQLADTALRSQPGDLTALLMRCYALAESGNETQAKLELARLKKSFPGWTESQLLSGHMELRGKNYKGAEQEFRAAFKPNGDDPRALQGLTVSLLAQKENKKALAILEQIPAGSPLSSEASRLKAAVLASSGDAAGALAEYGRFRAVNPNSPLSYIAASKIHFEQGDSEKAIQVLREGRDRNPDDPALNLELGKALEDSGNVAEAISRYREVLRVDPANILAMNNLAYVLAESGAATDEAARLIEAAIRRNPGDPGFRDTLGWVQLKRNAVGESVKTFEGLVKQYPDVGVFRYHFAAALAASGDKTRARVETQAALRGDLPAKETRLANQLLASLGG